MTKHVIDYVPLDSVDADAIDALLDRAFGVDRHRRTAYVVRRSARAIPALSIAALEAGALVGSIQCWPVTLTADDGTPYPLVMIGPVAVDPDRQRDGIGRVLMTRSLAAARDAGLDGALMLIGDPEYYERFFGFTAARTALWRLPGPVEPRRLLARGDAVPDMPGVLGALAD